MSRKLNDQTALHDRIVKALSSKPDDWGEDPDTVIQVIETHGATVLLGQKYAIKVKKPVLFDHMDYSSPARRRKFCELELERNQRTAKDLYIGVFPIYTDKDGAISLSGTRNAAEYALKMHRFGQGQRLDEISAQRLLDPKLCLSLAEDIADLHHKAEIIANDDRIPNFEHIIHQNFQQFYNFCPDILNRNDVDDFLAQLISVKRQLEPLIKKQILDKQVRIGHGDLHLQNICLFKGRPRIFDAIEYQDYFTVSDILYDLAFLLMDLIDKDQRQAANLILNEYVADMGWLLAPERFAALKLLPFYLCLRAGIRCHVAANRSRQCTDEAERADFAQKAQYLFKSASDYLIPTTPTLYAIGGFSGSGKSTLARQFAADISPAPGAVILRTDVIRRHLVGADKYSPMPQSAYTPSISDQVYTRMRELTSIITKAGISVILDAVFDRMVDRDRIDDMAARLSIPFQGIWLDVSRNKMMERISGRTNDASDATAEILQAQLNRSNGIETTWLRLPADGSPNENYALLTDSLKKLR